MKHLIMAACLALAACADPGKEASTEDGDGETAFEPLTRQVDRAKAVEETVEQHRRDLDAALEEAEDRDESR